MTDTSPRPWKRNDNTINAADGSLVAVLGTTVGDAPWAVRARLDGDLIVQAVNAQDEAMAALVEAIHTIEDVAGYRYVGGTLARLNAALAQMRSEAVSA